MPCDPVARRGFAALDSNGLHIVPDHGDVATTFVRRCVALGLPPPTVAASVPETASRVLLLNALSSAATRTERTQIVLETFQTLRALARTHRSQRFELWLAQDLGGDFGLISDPGPRAELGAVAGLAKTAAREWPQATVRVLDLPAGLEAETCSERLAEALASTTAGIETGLSATVYQTPQLVPAITRSAPSHPIATGDVWLVSGGARGVTASCLHALARRAPLRLALLGRTAIDEPESSTVHGLTTDADLKRALLEDARRRDVKLTPPQLQRLVTRIVAARETRASCEALRAAGCEVSYFAVDVADWAAVAAVVSQVRAQWGAIRGLVHAAGVLADKWLHEKTDERFLDVYRTKVDGFHALLEATHADPLTAIGCFSSVAGRAGNVGQADYAAANEALNKICQSEQRRRGSACLVRAINWGPWDGGMVSPGLKSHFAAMGVALIPIAEGAEIFADILTGARPTTVECVVGAGAEVKARDAHS